MDYAVKIQGDARAALRFDRFPEMAHDGLAARIADLTDTLAGAVRAAVPEGVTGRLKSQVASGVENTPNRIRGWVSLAGASAADVKKAAALEFGSRGQKFAVKGYQREMDHVFSRSFAPFDQVVNAYRRAGGLEAIDFLHGPLAAQAPGALEELKAVVDQAIKESE